LESAFSDGGRKVSHLVESGKLSLADVREAEKILARLEKKS
jgi:hypothetical protein